MNATTAHRQSFGNIAVNFLLIGVPTVAVCGIHTVPAIGATILFAGWGYFNHANLRLSMGRLTPILSGPQWHRLHHGVARNYHDCNFAAFFPVLDIVFGTYRAPARDEFPETGVDDGMHFKVPELEIFSPLFASSTGPRRSKEAPSSLSR